VDVPDVAEDFLGFIVIGWNVEGDGRIIVDQGIRIVVRRGVILLPSSITLRASIYTV
jgi:hypothetical protein